MLFIAAALSDEIRVALELCAAPARSGVAGLRVWRSTYRGLPVLLSKTGVGFRSEQRLRLLLEASRPSRILVIGFAGALDPALKLGELFAVRRASILSIREGVSWTDDCTLSASFELDRDEETPRIVRQAGLSWNTGDCLTSPYTIGDPPQKAALRARFGAGVIDMETAVLARAAKSAGIPIACIRAVSDEADDQLLAPFSRAASSSAMFQVRKAVGRAHLAVHWNEWQQRVARAQQGLRRYLRAYLDSLVSRQSFASIGTKRTGGTE